MRTILVLIVGIALGAFGLYYYQQQPASPGNVSAAGKDASVNARDAADRAVIRTREVAANVSHALGAKMQEWHLTPDDIRAELARSGQVVRENTTKLREKASDARIITAIKAKYVLEKDIPANAVSVDSANGRVTLSGSLGSEALVAKAVALALDTDGVQGVTSTVKVGGTR